MIGKQRLTESKISEHKQALTAKQQLIDDTSWLANMLPFITKIILALTIFFFSVTIYQLFELNSRVDSAPKLSIDKVLESHVDREDHDFQWKTLVALESHALQQRYHQASVLLMARIWVRYLGFITGMMLTIIGAIFILGRLREPKTEIELGGKISTSIATQSPGIVLVVMGSTIMLTTILTHNVISVNDAPIYISHLATQSPPQSNKPEELKTQDSKETHQNVAPPAATDDIDAQLKQAWQNEKSKEKEKGQ